MASASSRISGLRKTLLSRSAVESSTCMYPEEASWVSNDGKPASSGVSLMSHQSSSTQKSRMNAGMKNIAHVASTGWVLRAKKRRIVE